MDIEKIVSEGEGESLEFKRSFNAATVDTAAAFANTRGGRILIGVTLEELHEPTHASKPRNRLIAQVFYDMGMIEKYGSGIGRIVDACRKGLLPEPDFGNYSGGFRVLFRPSKWEGTDDTPQVTPQVAPQVAPQVTPQVGRLLQAVDENMSGKLLMERLGLNDRMHFRKKYLQPALKQGVIEMTIPDKPNSRLQKYRLTDAGRALLNDEG